jgi:hypothetical protein
MIDSGNPLMAYMIAQEHRQRMYAEYNAAARGLEMASVKERSAEVRSQSEPLHTLLRKLGFDRVLDESRVEMRELLCGLAEYVAYGRSLKEPEKNQNITR